MSSELDAYVRYFLDNEPLYNRLKDEVEFILDDRITGIKVKAHSISGRTKKLESVLEKIERKGYTNPQEEVEDVVGCRVVCLFLSDLPKVEALIREEFNVTRAEDSVEGVRDIATFGYMSRHYICQLTDKYAGARYDRIKGIKFEVQLRTILMDAWANVSHYLAYKGEMSIPGHLRRDFHALSGLFYVADRHFQLFFQQAEASEEIVLAKASSGDFSDDEAINVETVRALFAQIYPDRRRGRTESVSEFIEEIAPLGYSKIGDLRKPLLRAHEAALKLEADHPPAMQGPAEGESDISEVVERPESSPIRYQDIGIARQALSLADPKYAELKYAGSEKPWHKYRMYLKKK